MSNTRVALVTGASGAIGTATGIALARAGADVAVHFHQRHAEAEAVAEAVRAAGRRAFIVRADVRDYAQVDAMARQTAAALGPVQILVNNAGLTRDNLAAFMTADEWNTVIDTNLKGAFHCIKACSRGMARGRWGRIVNVSSDAGLMGDVMRANYSSSKAGMLGLTKTMARELAASGITVNAVAPGFIESDMTAGMQPGKREKSLAAIPLRRFGRPDEIAAVICFLASDASAYITGQTLVVDGGMRTRD
jgi:3-oxoacyl-[acyl-carrier protein] reductase